MTPALPMMTMMPMMMPGMGAMGMMPGMMPGAMGAGAPMPMACMMASMTCSMTANGMKCEMRAMDTSMKDMFMACCSQMAAMASCGMPMMCTCGGMSLCCTTTPTMPMMMPTPGGMCVMAKMTCALTADGMCCEIMCMDAAMKATFMACCTQMMAMMNCGVPMMMGLPGMPALCCCCTATGAMAKAA